MDSQEQAKIKTHLNQVLALPNIRRSYYNTFAVNLSLTDVMIVFYNNGRPEEVINLSLNTAKSLSQTLTNLIKDFEDKGKQTILTMGEIEKILVEVQK